MILELFEKMENFLNYGDPIIRQWFLIRQTYLPFLLCAVYILFVKVVGPALMRNRKPFKLRRTMIVFNCCIVATYVYALITLIIYLPMISWDIFCYGGKVIYGHPTHKLAVAAWAVYVLKYVEFFDTVFFVLRKKQQHISLLHVFHHTIVPILGFIVIRTEKSGLPGIPAIVNGIVHIIMYSYYALAAIGPHVRKYLWWKKYLTQLQMAQFIFMTVFVAVAVPLTGCTILETSFLMTISIPPMFLYLFYQFYKSTFQNKETHKSSDPPSMKEEDSKTSKVHKSVLSLRVCNGNCLSSDTH